jgi:hypothetical protein
MTGQDPLLPGETVVTTMPYRLTGGGRDVRATCVYSSAKLASTQTIASLTFAPAAGGEIDQPDRPPRRLVEVKMGVIVSVWTVPIRSQRVYSP